MYEKQNAEHSQEAQAAGSELKATVRRPHRYFSYDPNDGFDTHETAAEAEAAADRALEGYRDEAPDGWSEDVTGVCWGEIKQVIVMTERRPRNDDDICDPCFTEVVDYGLVDAV